MKTSQPQKRALFKGEVESDTGKFFFHHKTRQQTINSLVRLGYVKAVAGPTHGTRETYWKFYHFGQTHFPASRIVSDVSYYLTEKGQKHKDSLRVKGETRRAS